MFHVWEASRLRGEDFKQQQVGSKASDPWPYWSYVLSFSSIHTGLHALILLPKPYTFMIWVYTWLVMLSHVVLSTVQVSHLYDVEFGLCLSVREVVSHLPRCDLTVWGSMLWFEQWLEWWRWLIPSWHVVLESAKDRILGVDTLGQHVPPCVLCGVACLLIRNTIGCVSCLDEWEFAWDFAQAHMVQEGPRYRASTSGNLSTASGAVVPHIYPENHSKAWHTSVVDLCQQYVVISKPYTKGMAKRRFSSHRRVMKSLLVGIRH
jgi:hypothetical protein